METSIETGMAVGKDNSCSEIKQGEEGVVSGEVWAEAISEVNDFSYSVHTHPSKKSDGSSALGDGQYIGSSLEDRSGLADNMVGVILCGLRVKDTTTRRDPDHFGQYIQETVINEYPAILFYNRNGDILEVPVKFTEFKDNIMKIHK